MKTDFVSQVYIIRTKIQGQNKNTVGAKNQEPVGMNLRSFSAAQEVCSTLENQAKCDSAVFVTNPLKIHFFAHVLIARSSKNYNCYRSAIVPSLLIVQKWSLYYAVKTIWAATWQNQQNECAPSEDSDHLGIWSESSLSAWRNLGSLATHWVHIEDSNQTGQMSRLIWVFAGRTLVLFALSCCDSYCSTHLLSLDFTGEVWILFNSQPYLHLFVCVEVLRPSQQRGHVEPIS